MGFNSGFKGLIDIRAAESGSGSSEKIISGFPSKGGPTGNLYTKSERLVLSCRVIWAWSERVNLYSRQKTILPRKTKTYVILSGPEPR